MRKAILPLILCLLILFSGCAGDSTSAAADSAVSGDAQLTVVTSFYPVWLLTAEVTQGVDTVTVSNMAPAQSGCLHDYTLTMNDLKALEKADLFLINGSGMEGFTQQVTDAFPSLQTVALTEGEQLLHGVECAHDHDDNHDHGVYNAHLWLSPDGAAAMAENIAEAMAELDAENAGIYRANAERLAVELDALCAEYQQRLSGVTNPHIVIFHESFAYLAEALGLEVVGVIAKEADEEPTAKELTEVIAAVKEYSVTALFTDSQYDDRAAQTVAAETGAEIYELDSLVTEPDGDAAGFAGRMRANFEVIAEALYPAAE